MGRACYRFCLRRDCGLLVFQSMIRAQSKARQKQLREYAIEAPAYLLAHPVCAAHSIIWGMSVIMAHSNQVHHKRGRIGTLLTDKRFWMAVCSKCHGWINAHPSQARERGLIAPLGQWNQTEKLRQQKERNAHT